MNSFAIVAEVPLVEGDTEDTIADRLNEIIAEIFKEIGLGREEISVRAELFHPDKDCRALVMKSMSACTCPNLVAQIEPIATSEEEALLLQSQRWQEQVP